MNILEDSMNITKRLLLAILLIVIFASCMPYYATAPNERNYLWVNKYWLGYTDGTVNSNKQQDVAVIYEGTEKTGSSYTLYLANEDELRFSVDNSNSIDLNGKEPRTTLQFKSQDVRDVWHSATDTNDNKIPGIYDIYDDKEHEVIFLSTNQGIYYKKYTPNALVDINSTDEAIQSAALDSMKFSKIENPSLKAINTQSTAFHSSPASNKPLSSEDIDGYAIDIKTITTASGAEIDTFFIATSTGLYFSTDLFPGKTFRNDPNGANWAHIVGATIIPMGNKDQDYPLATIPGAYREFNESTGKMEIYYKDKFYIGDEAWGIDQTNFDPIYDPVYDPTYNRFPDFYASSDGEYIDSQGNIQKVVMGQPITWEQYAIKNNITNYDTKSYHILSAAQKEEQHKLRLYYETILEKDDYGNPNNRDTGVIRTYAYYRDKFLKATQIKGVSVYDNIVYLATVGGGITYCDLDLLTKDIDSTDYHTFNDDLIWETYTRNHFHYPALLSQVNARAEENFWSLESIWGQCIVANENGIFYGANYGGIHQASTYKSIRTVRDVNGLAYDYNGNTQCIITKDSNFEFFNQYYYPKLKEHLINQDPLNPPTEDQIADLYYRPDRDYYDGIGNENLVQGLRLNWKEYTTQGWSIYVAPGDVAPVRLPVLNFPSNQVLKIRFGKLGNKDLIYIATREGMGIAEIRKTYSLSDYVKVPAAVTGEEQYNVDFVNWGAYNKDLTTLGEINFIRDIDSTKDANGDDYYTYTATYGQGLVRYHWKSYDQIPFNLDLESLGFEVVDPFAP